MPVADDGGIEHGDGQCRPAVKKEDECVARFSLKRFDLILTVAEAAAADQFYQIIFFRLDDPVLQADVDKVTKEKIEVL